MQTLYDLVVLIGSDEFSDGFYGTAYSQIRIVSLQVLKTRFFSFLIGYDQEAAAAADMEILGNDEECCRFHLRCLRIEFEPGIPFP